MRATKVEVGMGDGHMGAAGPPGPPGKREPDDEGAAPIDPAEHLTRDLARVRAKFAVDPALASRSLAKAWQTETAVEGDEAEFVDTVADCLGAGLPLDDALNCWDTGDLVYQAADESERDDDTVPIRVVPARQSSAAHRVLVR